MGCIPELRWRSPHLPVHLRRFRRYTAEMFAAGPPESRVGIESELIGQLGHITGAVFEYAPRHLHARPCYVFCWRSSRIAVRRNVIRESFVEAMGINITFFD